MPQLVRGFGLLVALSLLTGCTVMNGDALEASVDRSLITGSITPASAPDLEQVSDSRTVRNAVSAANLSSVETNPLSWSNVDTGASGTITSIVEARSGNVVCRSFTTSRQRFDGISLYDGEACMNGGGEWELTRFSQGG